MMKFKYLIIFLLTYYNACIPFVDKNPCDLLSTSNQEIFITKLLLNDSGSHCGVSIRQNKGQAPRKFLGHLSNANPSSLIWEDGRVKTWGWGFFGMLGYGNTKNVGDGAPTNLSIKESNFLALPEPVLQISSGGSHTCALLSSGNVRCWGAGADGQLGYNNTNNIGDGIGLSLESISNVPIGEKVTQISMGFDFSCALLVTGAVRCWGSGQNGRLGYNDTQNVGNGVGPSILSRGNIPLGGTATQISAGGSHACALMSNRAIRCWGSGSSGQLGYNSVDNVGDGLGLSIIASGDIVLGGQAIQVSSGNASTCAILSTGSLRCWGDNSDGNLGYNNTIGVGDSIATSIINVGDVPIGSLVQEISLGSAHSCALLKEGNVRCWGDNSSGQLGYNNNQIVGGDAPAPSILAAGDIQLGGKAVQISASRVHTCALLESGGVRCFGQGTTGRLGYNSTANIADGQGTNKTILQAGDLVLE
ncbi:MAG: hypothetical protein CK427_10515 [Leptospira sp.]|jgi:alpha-tubulin suppressor-like RCC1 family protein|nr:MAG: hypothetical protein CK427_10515 [Leptospira sp.]